MYAANKATDIVKPYSKQNALEGVSDMQYVNQVLTPEKITKTTQNINYLAQNAPEIL